MDAHTENKKPDFCNICGKPEGEVKFYTRRNQRGKTYWNLRCSLCKGAIDRAHRKAYMVKIKKNEPERYYRIIRHEQLRTRYRMSLTDYEKIFEQQGRGCAICGVDDRSPKHSFSMPVDHCHKTGKNRGILCRNCNHVLGKVKDSPKVLRAAATYLETWSNV